MTDMIQPRTQWLGIPRSLSRSSLTTWFARPTSKTLVMNVGILIALGIWFSIETSSFLATQNLTNLIRQVAFVGIAACAVTPVMIAGGLDLSIGATVAVAGVTAATLVAHSNWPLPLAFAAGVAAGGIVGSVNAFLVVVMRINSVIATLGTLYIGLAVNWLTAALGAFTLISYIFIYTPLKRVSTICRMMSRSTRRSSSLPTSVSLSS